VTRIEWREIPPGIPARRCSVCGSTRHLRQERHHVVRAQVVRRCGGSVYDARNRLLICGRCHDGQTNRSQKIPLVALPDCAYEFAVELLGPGRAYNLLRREYEGNDWRLENLLAQSAENGQAVRRAEA
jgi:hypothetical protein